MHRKRKRKWILNRNNALTPQKKKNPQNILVYVGGDLVGDALIKLPFIHGLRASNPNAHITWCHGQFDSVFASILAPLATGYLDEILSFDSLRSQPQKAKAMDLVIDTQLGFWTALKLKYYFNTAAFFSPAARYSLSDFKPPRGTPKPANLCAQLLGFLQTLNMDPMPPRGVSLPPELEELATRLLPPGPRYIGLAVGAGMRIKCWPASHYQSLARLLVSKGYQPVVLLGPQEADWIEAYQRDLPEALYPLQDPRIDKQSPLLTIALAKKLIAAVANDCGLGHMIATANTPLVTLFGPTTAEKFAPYVSQGLLIKAQDFGGTNMDSIPVDAVIKALTNFLITLDSR